MTGLEYFATHTTARIALYLLALLGCFACVFVIGLAIVFTRMDGGMK